MTAPGREALAATRPGDGLENPRDGLLDRLFHRRLSHHLTRLLLRTPLSPNVVTVIGIAFGVAGGLALGAPGGGALLAAVLLLGIVGAFVVISWIEGTEGRRRRVAAWENRILDRVLSPLTTRDWHLFVVAFALAGRLDLLVPAAAAGAHVFWVTALVLLVRSLRRARV